MILKLVSIYLKTFKVHRKNAYADDAGSLPNDKPMIVGKAEIREDIVTRLAKRAKGTTVAFEVMDVFGDENTVTEVGKITGKNAAEKTTYSGKCMAV